MKLKINKSLIPIKAHFFFFFAALGPILPQLNVFGRQLGVSPGAMGLVTAVLPLLWAAAKPLFGYVVDYWPTHRKLVFMLLIIVMTGSYCGLWFLPMPEEPLQSAKPPIIEHIYKLNDTIYVQKLNNSVAGSFLEKYICHWSCHESQKFNFFLSNSTYVNTVYVDGDVTNISCSLFHMNDDDVREGQTICSPKDNCDLLCFEDDDISSDINGTGLVLNRTKRALDNKKADNSSNDIKVVDIKQDSLGSKDIHSKTASKMIFENAVAKDNDNDNFYMTTAFWGFVILMCIGTVAFNVANCIGDAVCFDVLGPDRGSKYGAQRAWGTAGYGITALLGGWLVDVVSGSHVYKDFTPAFVVALVATVIDLYSCRALTLPSLTSPEDSGKALCQVLRIPRVIVFIFFAVIAGTFDSFIIYYMFWFLEELAEQTGHMAKIKLIEGIIVAGQSFVGELLLFFFSGKILKRFGYGKTLTFSLLCYGIRMALISLIGNPWHLVFIEAIMQGPTYALCYATIVGYAAQVAPEGYSATVQGIVAGMDDGVGFAVGSLVGGQLYGWVGGRIAFRTLAVVAVGAALAHAVLFAFVTRGDDTKQKQETVKAREEGEKMLPTEQYDNVIYKATVVPLTDRKSSNS